MGTLKVILQTPVIKHMCAYYFHRILTCLLSTCTFNGC